MDKGPTARQSQVLTFIGEFMAVRGYSPSIRDIAAHFGFSVTAAYGHVLLLEKKGVLSRSRYTSRSLHPTAQAGS